MGAYLSTPNKEKESRDGGNHIVRYGASAMQGWRTGMEDAHITEPDLAENMSLFGVFDGHGGKEVALFCERNFAAELKKSEAFQRQDYAQALIQTFLRMDQLLTTPEGKRQIQDFNGNAREEAPGNDRSELVQKIVQEFARETGIQVRLSANGQPEETDENDSVVNSGCTAVVALKCGNQLIVANAGDSRCVLSRNGVAVEMSLDHKPDLETEKARIRAAGGTVSMDGRVNGNLNLSRAIGDMEYKRDKNLRPEEQMITAYPDIRTATLTDEDDFVVLACDGVWDVMTNQAVVDFVRERLQQNMKLSEIVEQIFENCIAPDPMNTGGLGCDNMTCLIVTLQPQANRSTNQA
eukprot:GILK01000994.1.p1 GENE.GILK01000994.1~~GILK01000994.1.p1  ORF type:complete len:362 (-),score=45.61 GILK01000994.1:171-1223(-)